MQAAERVLVACRAVLSAEDRAAHYDVRHRVFVEEQGLFAGSDRDLHDESADTIHVVGCVDDLVCGAVRLYPLPGSSDDPPGAVSAVWKGDRLAVLPGFRAYGLGAPLVRHAVRSAAERGGQVMVARIQLSNVTFFQRLGWQLDGDVETYVGVAHQPMAIHLP